ncbi:UNVERIFIED_CONTAM: hypothetical protein FKN15_073070 [Acipenser sinensis]
MLTGKLQALQSPGEQLSSAAATMEALLEVPGVELRSQQDLDAELASDVSSLSGVKLAGQLHSQVTTPIPSPFDYK